MTPVTIGPSSPLSSAPPSSSSSSFLSADDDDTFGFPPIHSPHASHLPPPTKRARRRPRKSTREGPSTRSQKLQAIHKLIIRRGWKMTDLLDAYAAEGRSGSPESKQYRNFWHQFKRFAYRDLLRKDNEDAPLNKKDWDHILNAGGYDHVVHVLRQELKKLGQSFSAGTFQYPTAGKSLDLGSLDFLESLRGDVQTKAPRLTEFLCMLARPAHKSAHQAVPLGPHQTIWVAMFLFAMQRKKCNNIPRLLGMYFVNSGVKKRVVDLLSTIGLCVSYTTVQECFKGIADVAEVQVRILGSDPRRNDAYDNYDFAEHKSGERLGQRKKFITLTNGVQFIGIEMPTGGLRQDMWKPSIQLKATDIVRKLGGSRLFNQVRKYTVYTAIQAAFPAVFEGDFLQTVHSIADMPKMDEVKIGPTRYHPFAPVFQNEGTNEGNVAIQSNYEEKQCGLDPSDIRWSYLLKPTFGDLKTVQRILSVQDMRRYTAETPYDKKNWMVAGLGLWHLRLNMLKLIHKIHWGGSKPMDSSTLQYAADAWDRSNVNTASDFTKLEELCIHSHHARITGLLLYSSGRDFTRREEAEEWLRTCSRARIVTLLDRIVELVNPNGFNDLKQTEPLNEVWYNHQCFIRHMNIYLLLCHAIKFADIGLLRQALREACVMFQAKEGQTTNYGPELLRLMHLYDSDASHPQLQRAMLVNSLVNLRGVYGKTFEVDRLVEFLNAFVAIVRKDRANSTKPMEELLRQIVLISPYMLELKRRLESQFGRPRSGEHPIKNASEDIWTMALNLVQRDFRYMDKEVFSAYLATNLTASGYDSLSDNVLRYNEKMASGVTMDDAIPTEENHSSTNTNSQSYESMDEVLESFLGTTT